MRRLPSGFPNNYNEIIRVAGSYFTLETIFITATCFFEFTDSFYSKAFCILKILVQHAYNIISMHFFNFKETPKLGSILFCLEDREYCVVFHSFFVAIDLRGITKKGNICFRSMILISKI